MSIFNDINALVGYGLSTGILDKADIVYTQNKLLEILGLSGFEDDFDVHNIPDVKEAELENILRRILDFAKDKKLLLGDGVVYEDLFDTRIMGALTPPPSYVIRKFEELHNQSPKEATSWFYKFSKDTNYIRRYRIAKDLKWKVSTEYGKLDITINLSKPEKDPKAIALAKNSSQNGYPKCLLCRENEGYAGSINHAARQNHRIIPLTLSGDAWGLQYSPYVYYNEHCIVFNFEHTPMKICRKTFERLFDFIKLFPYYTIGSNADLPIVGGSILSHDHFQGGFYEFPMAVAKIEKIIEFQNFPDVEAGIVQWPLSVIRLSSKSPEKLVDLSDKILEKWRCYTDEQAFIFAETDNIPHNTITPIARMRGEKYEIDLVLRNNITTEEHPLGVFHPHKELHHIKKENIGLIEVMGLAVLPARLKTEMEILADALILGKDIESDERISHHAEWAKTLPHCKGLLLDETKKMLRLEIGKVFAKVLEHAGVFKRDKNGREAFSRFLDKVAHI